MGDYYEELLEGIKPLPGTLMWLRSKGFLQKEKTLYQQENAKDPLTGACEQVVRCICTACQTEYQCDKVSSYGCHNIHTLAPFGFRLPTEEIVISGERHLCPWCGSEAEAYYTGRSASHGHIWLDSAYVTEIRKENGELCLVEWCFSKTSSKLGGVETRAYARKAFVVAKKTLIRLSGERTYFGGNTSWFSRLERRKVYLDDMGFVKNIAPWDPSILDGTPVENSKLEQYIAAAGKQCLPVSYLKVYLKHKNIENLLTAGMGKVVAEMIDSEWRSHAGYSNRCCRRTLQLEEIDFKQARPSCMLGLTTEEFRMAVTKVWGERELEAYRMLKELGESFELERDLRLVADNRSLISEIRKEEAKVLKVLRYLNRQGIGWRFLKDYHAMAQKAGVDLSSEIMRFPKNLQQAHDQMMERAKFQASQKQKHDFAGVYQKYQALQWSDKELCIRLPQEPDELIREGDVLRHCVGGYIDSHIKGKIILFVRHYRRPERSYYTLNIDMTGNAPKRIQLHGYGNERHGLNKEHKHTIPQKVLDFVARWEKEVLQPQFKRLKKKGA